MSDDLVDILARAEALAEDLDPSPGQLRGRDGRDGRPGRPGRDASPLTHRALITVIDSLIEQHEQEFLKCNPRSWSIEAEPVRYFKDLPFAFQMRGSAFRTNYTHAAWTDWFEIGIESIKNWDHDMRIQFFNSFLDTAKKEPKWSLNRLTRYCAEWQTSKSA